MRAIRLALLVAIVTGFLTGCATNPNPAQGALDVDVADLKPIKDLTVIFWFGSGVPACPEISVAYVSAFRPAMLTRLPAIFAANNIAVSKTLVESIPIKYLRTKSGELTLPLLDQVNTSHALVLIADAYRYLGTKCGPNSHVTVDFDARLWEVAKKRQIWSATPTYYLIEKQPLLRSQQFAGDLLNGLHRARVITLESGRAVDLTGDRLGASFVWTADK